MESTLRSSISDTGSSRCLAIFTTVVTVSAQSDGPDWKIAPTGLNVAAGDTAGDLNIAWDAQPPDQ